MRLLPRAVFASMFVLCGMLYAQTPATQPSTPPKLDQFDPAVVNKSVDPCDDFYGYVCSNWAKQNPIPPDMPSSGTVLPLYLWNQTILRDAMANAAANKSASGSERQIGDYWTSCMDEAGRNAKGAAWLQADLKQLDSIKSIKELARVLAYMHQNFASAWQGSDNQTAAPLFGFGPTQDLKDSSKVVAGLDQGGLGMPNRDYYLNSDERTTKLRDAYLAHVQTMFELAGEPAAKASADAKTVLSFETALAKAQMDNVTRRDPAKLYNVRNLVEIKKATPSFDWDGYFGQINAPKPEFYIVTAPDFFTAVEHEISTRPVGDVKTYFRWWLIHSSASALGDKFVNANFEFYGKALSGTQQLLPLWRRCVASADNYLGEALGQAYVNAAFPPESKAKALELIGDIRAALKQDIAQLNWMNEATKKNALVKLDAMEQKIGYPDKWRDYSSVKVVPDNYLANINSATGFEFHRQLNKIGKPVDRKEWVMTPATIDAYNDGQLNSINFPAGILQLPLFNGKQDAASNYGGIGIIIGHEIIHGFDDQGRKFDAHGNMTDWWTPEDAKNYDQRGDCIANQYTGPTPGLDVERNGRRTQGEDTADNGGTQLAMMALEAKYKRDGKSLDEPDASGITPRQRFFESFGFTWCRNTRPESQRLMVQTNPHSLPKYRVNNPLSNMTDFQQAFGCKKGQAMVHEPQCRVW